MSVKLVPTCRSALTGICIGVLVLGAALLTGSQAAAQGFDDTPSQGCGGVGTAGVTPGGLVIIDYRDDCIGEQSEPIGAVIDYPDNGIAEQSEPTGAYLIPADVIDLDSDGDGLFDRDEVNVYGTDPYWWDTDGDGVGDWEEVYLGTDPTA